MRGLRLGLHKVVRGPSRRCGQRRRRAQRDQRVRASLRVLPHRRELGRYRVPGVLQQRRARSARRAVGRHRNRVTASLAGRAWHYRDSPDALLRASPFPALSHARSHGTAQSFGKGRDTFPISFHGRGTLAIPENKCEN